MHVAAPMQGTVVSIDVAEGDTVKVGQQLVVLESMKMEHVVASEAAGVVTSITVAVGDTVMPGDALVGVEAREGIDAADEVAAVAMDLDHVRADLAEVLERHEVGLDHRRPDAVAKRRARGQRTARENVADLVDDGSFVEYAPVVVAAQRR
ncbi:MAG TPA: biotin/lipoyl-containing protein, partial [Acidimicrobiales bacterium]|nr:biotin/lipoyl-containing protein [Acidimicrobiales bacterium]